MEATLVVHDAVPPRSSGRLQKHARGSGVKRRMSPHGNGAWSLTSGRLRVMPGPGIGQWRGLGEPCGHDYGMGRKGSVTACWRLGAGLRLMGEC